MRVRAARLRRAIALIDGRSVRPPRRARSAPGLARARRPPPARSSSSTSTRCAPTGWASTATRARPRRTSTPSRRCDVASTGPSPGPLHAALADLDRHLALPPHPRRGAREDRMGPERETLAEGFRAAGLRPAAFVDGGYVSAPFGLDQGFDDLLRLQRRRRGRERGDASRWLPSAATSRSSSSSTPTTRTRRTRLPSRSGAASWRLPRRPAASSRPARRWRRSGSRSTPPAPVAGRPRPRLRRGPLRRRDRLRRRLVRPPDAPARGARPGRARRSWR